MLGANIFSANILPLTCFWAEHLTHGCPRLQGLNLINQAVFSSPMFLKGMQSNSERDIKPRLGSNHFRLAEGWERHPLTFRMWLWLYMTFMSLNIFSVNISRLTCSSKQMMINSLGPMLLSVISV